MKKTLLFVALSITCFANAQSLTQANEPLIGASESMYLCDSFTVNYAGVTGSGVTWDYTTLSGYSGEMRTVSITDASVNPNAADYPGATKVLNIGSFLSVFFNSTATDRISQGFLFIEPTFGAVLGKVAGDPEQLVAYPFAVGNSLSNTFSGNLETALGTNAITGQVYAEIDGQGTLNLPNAVSLPNVIRYKLVDTATAMGTLLGDLELIRNQFEYYDHAVSDLPILSFITVTVQNVGAGTPISTATLVLSYYEPEFLGLNEENTVNFTVYPNPTTDVITLNGEFDANASASIFNQKGKKLLTTNAKNGATIDLSSFDNGTYFLSIESAGNVSTQSIVKQ